MLAFLLANMSDSILVEVFLTAAAAAAGFFVRGAWILITSKRKARADRRISAIAEDQKAKLQFYWPVYVLLCDSLVTRETIRTHKELINANPQEDEKPRLRLINHLEREELMPIHDRILEIVKERTSIARPDEKFLALLLKYMAHVKVFKAIRKGFSVRPDWTPSKLSKPFPDEFLREVERRALELQSEYNKTLGIRTMSHEHRDRFLKAFSHQDTEVDVAATAAVEGSGTGGWLHRVFSSVARDNNTASSSSAPSPRRQSLRGRMQFFAQSIHSNSSHSTCGRGNENGTPPNVVVDETVSSPASLESLDDTHRGRGVVGNRHVSQSPIRVPYSIEEEFDEHVRTGMMACAKDGVHNGGFYMYGSTMTSPSGTVYLKDKRKKKRRQSREGVRHTAPPPPPTITSSLGSLTDEDHTVSLYESMTE